ncbi:glutamine synthetase family protein [Kiloniella laminariae]|uniref:glutamine synthetase family protein n=1 Tax=Kiloniella laminariae TaxID=454162 RepID=UPI000372B5F2|nr:glutamine synthetase family protein [Kiloniella laminariae]
MTFEELEKWCKDRRITEVECMIPDISGVPRGKILPTEKFLRGIGSQGHRLPESIFTQTVTGEFPEEDTWVDIVDRDVILEPDLTTIRPVPWYKEPTAQVICDCVYPDGRPVDIYARQILRTVLKLYEAKGWQPIIAPELEFYLVQKNIDPDLPLVPPIGKNGRPETARQCYGIDAVNEFDPVFEDVYDYCDAQGLDIDTLNHEAGAAQIEINFLHGDPLSLADQVFLFKRTVRQTALAHDIYATFMAKPMANEPGSSMHVHHSVLDVKTGKNIFTDEQGNASPLFGNFIAGLQHYAGAATLFFAPNINSYRRFSYEEAPINIHWGVDNRSCGLRVPNSSPESRRVENRLCGSDVNPYLAIAGSLLCGYLGIEKKLKAQPEMTGSAYGLPRGVPMYLSDAAATLIACQPIRDVLGDRFVEALCATKLVEYQNYHTVISSWEREHLLLNV